MRFYNGRGHLIKNIIQHLHIKFCEFFQLLQVWPKYFARVVNLCVGILCRSGVLTGLSISHFKIRTLSA